MLPFKSFTPTDTTTITRPKIFEANISLPGISTERTVGMRTMLSKVRNMVEDLAAYGLDSDEIRDEVANFLPDDLAPDVRFSFSSVSPRGKILVVIRETAVTA